MRAVNFEGYGVDFGNVLAKMPEDVRQEIEDFIYNNDYVIDYIPANSDIDLVAPTNTDSFYALFYIPTTYTVVRDREPSIRIYSVDEANLALRDTINEYIASMGNPNAWMDDVELLDQATVDAALAAVEPAIRESAGFDYEEGNYWSDVI